MRAGHVQRLLLPAGKLNQRQQGLEALALELGIRPERGDATAFAVAGPAGLRHQGALAWMRAQTGPQPTATDLLGLLTGLDHPPCVLVLDGIEDPRNLGACLRSADGAGADAVVLPRGRGAPLTAIARKTAAGAAEVLPVFEVSNLAQTLRQLQDRGLRIVGLADSQSHSLYQEDLRGPVCLVLGNEGQGLRRLTRELCDQIVALPMRGAVSSLNVSVASGIVLYEVLRQREAGNAL